MKYLIHCWVIFWVIVLSNEAQATCNLSISGLSPNQLEILDAADMNSSTKTKTRHIQYQSRNIGLLLFYDHRRRSIGGYQL